MTTLSLWTSWHCCTQITSSWWLNYKICYGLLMGKTVLCEMKESWWFHFQRQKMHGTANAQGRIPLDIGDIVLESGWMFAQRAKKESKLYQCTKHVVFNGYTCNFCSIEGCIYMYLIVLVNVYHYPLGIYAFFLYTCMVVYSCMWLCLPKRSFVGMQAIQWICV